MANNQKPSTFTKSSKDNKFKIWWDDKENILREKPSGNINETCAKNMVTELFKLANTKPGKVLVLTDMSEGGSASSAARKIFAEELKNEKFARHAFFGLTMFIRVLVSFIVHASGVNNVAYFKSEDKALKWLKEK